MNYKFINVDRMTAFWLSQKSPQQVADPEPVHS